MTDDELVSFWSKTIFEIGFIAVATFYIFRLINLNNELKTNVDTTKAFDVAMYNNAQPCFYVIYALIIVLTGTLLATWYCASAIRHQYTLSRFAVLAISSLLANLTIIISIWQLINNPILKAVMAVIICGGGFAYVTGTSNA